MQGHRDNAWKNLCEFFKYVIERKEVYTLPYPRSIYDNSRQDLGETTKKFRNTDVKKMLKILFKDKVMCSSSKKKYHKAEYALASQLNMSYKVIKTCISDWGIPKYVAIKTITQMLYHSLHENEMIVKWSPTHQHIVTMNNDRDIDNVNLVSLIIYREKRVKLSNSKVQSHE